MTNSERLRNFLKVEMLRSEQLQMMYNNQINLLISLYESKADGKGFMTINEVYEYYKGLYANEINVLETMINNEEKEELGKMYLSHCHVVALESLLSRIEYLKPMI